MSPLELHRQLPLIFMILMLLQIPSTEIATKPLQLTTALATANTPENWREASATRVIIRSSADWGRILFDDLNGTNSNGIRIRSVVSSGWLEGRDSDDVVYAGRKIAWPDTEYDRVITRKGDMVAFYKGLGDFHYTEAYADLTFELDIDLARVYVWLMTGGNGTTTFEIVSRDTGGFIWRDVVVGSGETLQVKRVMSPQPFFQTGRAESTIVVTWLSIALLAIIFLNFPVARALRKHLRRKTESAGPVQGERPGGIPTEEAAGRK